MESIILPINYPRFFDITPTTGHWRSVADDPPPLDTDVLVSDGTSVIAASWLTRTQVCPQVHGEQMGENMEIDPKWWMPLPEPPGSIRNEVE